MRNEGKGVRCRCTACRALCATHCSLVRCSALAKHGHGTPCPYALTPHSYALTPTTSLLTPTPSLLTPHSYALTPHSYDLTPHSSPDNRPPLEVPPLVAENTL